MKKASLFKIIFFLIIVVIGIFFGLCDRVDDTGHFPDGQTDDLAHATFSGGCFWCSEAAFQNQEGVFEVISGYTGDSKKNASYEKVARGLTGHREAVRVTFSPASISYEELLEIYWSHIDPTDAGGQFADRGHQYTTAIYYHSDAQRGFAETSKANLARSELFQKPIATEILPATEFYPAEDYHQDYFLKASEHYKRYEAGSGRKGFTEDTWAREAALEFFEK